jgi:hypothetical protein
MFSKLKEVSIKGEKRNRKDKAFLKQLSTGVYCTLSEKLLAYDPNGTETMTALRYQSVIVLLSLWERNPETSKYEPYLVLMTNQLRKKREMEPLPYNDGEFSAFFRSLPPKEFIEVVDYFSDQCGREELDEVYSVTDAHLQPTSEETKKALGNE